MDNIPEVLRIKMCLDSIILQKNEQGWKEIHIIIDSPNNKCLYLKKTNYIFEENLLFEYILRMSGSVCFYGKPYTWLNKVTTSSYGNMYWYNPIYLKNGMNDLFSTDSEGNFIDDYEDDYDDYDDD